MPIELTTTLFAEDVSVRAINEENDAFTQLMGVDLTGVQEVMHELGVQQHEHGFIFDQSMYYDPETTNMKQTQANETTCDHCEPGASTQNFEKSWKGQTRVYAYEGPRCSVSNLPKTKKRIEARNSHTFDPKGKKCKSKSRKNGFVMLSMHEAPSGKKTAGGYDEAIRFVPWETYENLLCSMCPKEDELIMDCAQRKGDCFVCGKRKKSNEVWAGIFKYKDYTIEATNDMPAMHTKRCSVPSVICIDPECISYIIKRMAELPMDTSDASSSAKSMAKRIRIADEQNSLLLAQVHKQDAKIKQLKKQQDLATKLAADKDKKGGIMPKAMLTSEDVIRSIRNLNQALEAMNMNTLDEDRHILVSNAREEVSNVLAAMQCNEAKENEAINLRKENEQLRKRVLELEEKQVEKLGFCDSPNKKARADAENIINLLCNEDVHENKNDNDDYDFLGNL